MYKMMCGALILYSMNIVFSVLLLICIDNDNKNKEEIINERKPSI